MATNATEEMTLKLLVDGASEKVLYAEAKKDFIDFLIGLLQIPIGSIMAALAENGLKVPGSLGRVQKSVSDMETSHFHSTQLKDNLVRPKVYSLQDQYPCNPPLLLKDFVSWDSTGHKETKTPMHGHGLVFSVPAAPAPASTDVEGYVKADNCVYMVMDDLVVSPMSTISVFALLKKFKIKDLGLLEEKIVTIDFKRVWSSLRLQWCLTRP